jgi:phenylalanyl-tRNA synthetase beta chain
MQISELWLRELVNPNADVNDIAHRLTMAGLEVETVESLSINLDKIVVGEVLTEKAHPNSDHLHLCTLNVGESEILQIVCGAANVRAGLKVPVALVDAVLPSGLKIKKAKLRGEESCGMICSEKELGLAEESNGIMELPLDAPVGENISSYLRLNDNILNINITPNRGDCLSVLGIAREVSALYELPILDASLLCHSRESQNIDDSVQIKISASADCPHYVGRIIRGVKNDIKTPLWMQEKLRRSGINLVSPIVDITNYVMIELGQPMHAFDLAKLQGGINIRKALPNESLTLLNQQPINLTADALVIADDNKPLALAGVMGGLDSAISDSTCDILLESAFFAPQVIAAAVQHYNINSDSSYRFVRGVDPKLQIVAIERATELILSIVNGNPGQICEASSSAYSSFSIAKEIQLRKEFVCQVLGLELSSEEIVRILAKLGMEVAANNDLFTVKVPCFRFDISLEIDLVEEIARIKGYDQIPIAKPIAKLQMVDVPETKLSKEQIRNLFVGRDYSEAITYSFVADELQNKIYPGVDSLKLKNPLSSEHGVMRTSLWPGLLNVAIYNHNRQQTRIRLFEIGTCFRVVNEDLQQKEMVGGLILGAKYPIQWRDSKQQVDFFTVKSDLMALLKQIEKDITWAPFSHPILHPGRTAGIYRNNELVGTLGELHPQICREFDFNGSVFVFEIELGLIAKSDLPKYKNISKFPSVTRDIAVVVDEKIPVANLLTIVKNSGGILLNDMKIFDIYRGENIGTGKKSVALSLQFQHQERTLLDGEIEDLVSNIIEQLTNNFNATLRG